MRSKKISKIDPKKFESYIPSKKLSWNHIMKYDENIENNNKFIINGLRLIYVKDIISLLEKQIGKKNCKVYKTGSSNLTSDIDVQIVFNISLNHNRKFYKDSIKHLVNIIKQAQSDWGKNFTSYLDVNFYPLGIFNFSDNIIDSPLVVNHSNTNDYDTCFIPYLKDEKLKKEFLLEDCKRCFNKPILMNNKKLFDFYKNLYNNSVECYYSILKNIKNKNTDYKYHNELMLCITKFNNKGPEMYYSIGAIIMVVWYMQLKYNLPKHVLKVLSISSYFENKNHYERTKNLKYKKRMDESYKHIDKKLYKYIKNKIIKS